MLELPLFPTAVVGSWPRPPELVRALRAKRAGRMSREEFDALADQAVRQCVRLQLEAGVDLISDGEQRRDNFISFVAEKFENVRMLSVSELLDYVEDKASFEEILGTLDVPAYALSNPAAVGPVSRRRPIALDEVRFLRQLTDRPVKAALPGPYLLTRAMWVEGLSQDTYPTKEDLARDLVAALREELDELIAEGVEFIQLDEPVLTELVFTQKNAHRTFMCGALTAKADREQELAFAVELINQVVAGMRGRGSIIGVHVCRGNWSTQEEILLRGPYEPLMPYLRQLDVDQLVLEYATPRAGELTALASLDGQQVGLGVVNPRTPEVEGEEAICARVREAMAYVAPERLFLNPDCGFATFAQRPMNSVETACRKLQAMVGAARRLRAEVGAPAPRP